MGALDTVTVATTLLETIDIIKRIIDKHVGYNEQIKQKFVKALKEALKPTIKDNDSYIEKATRQIDDLIALTILIMSKQSLNQLSINDIKIPDDIKIPNYISKNELMNFYRQVIKNRELHRFLLFELQKFTSLTKNNNGEINKRFPDILTDTPFKADTTNVIGREKDLEKLWKILSEKRHIVLTGIGGIGKTQLAQLLFHKHKGEFEEVAWIEYRGCFKNSVLESIKTPLFKDDKYQSIKERRDDIINKLRNDKKKKLFVIDNVENEADQHPRQDVELINLTGWDETYILLTSRSEEHLVGYENFTLESLKLEKCIELFKHYHESSDSEYETIVKIINLAYSHTMTIELLAKGVSEGENLETYYQKIKNGFESVDRKITSIRTKNVEATIEDQLKILYNIQVLEEKDRKIMNSFAMLPVNCDCKLKDIERWFGFEYSDLENVRKKGWLSYDKERKTFVIQPTVREIVRFDFKKDKQNKKSIAPEGTSDKILDFFKSHSKLFKIENGRDFGYVERMIGIAESVMGSAVQEESDCFAALYYNIGVGYDELGEYEKALLLFNKAFMIRKKILNVMQTNIANTYNNIGGVRHHQKDCDKALECYSNALSIWRNIFDIPNLTIAESYSKIGGAYRKKGEKNEKNGRVYLKIALKYHEWALEIREKYGKESIDVAISYNNIGTVYLAQKKYCKAKEYYNEALMIVEKDPQKNGRFMANLYNDMGNLYRGQNDYVKALDYYSKAYEKCKEILGENHPDTKAVLKNINSLK